MTIGIDGNEANVGKKVGIGQYAFELLSNMYRLQPEYSDVRFRIYLKHSPNQEMPDLQENWRYNIIHSPRLWTQVALPAHLYMHKRPSVFFSPTHYAPRFSPVPTAISIMDLSYLHFPELFKPSDLYQLKNWTRYSAEHARMIFTISEASKRDIMKIYKIPDSRITVTYPGVKFDEQDSSTGMVDVQKKYKLAKRYILFVGTLQPRKNIVRLFEAFKVLKDQKKYEDLELVVVGKKGWLYDEILVAPTKLGIDNSVKFLDFIPDEDMPSLYKQAQCFVLPSLYEGFGLPVLEAMTYDCPVVTSNISSLPEAGGDAALYFDPMNVADMAKIIEKVLSNDKLRSDMIKKGKLQIKKFSWEKTARMTLDVLMEIGKKS